MAMFTIKSEAISDGIGFGKVHNYIKNKPVEEQKNIPASERSSEKELLKEAIRVSDRDLQKTMEEVEQNIGKDKAAIFECHQIILSDEDFQNDMFNLIDIQGYSAPYAAQVVAEKNALEMEELEDPTLAARAADFRDIGQRLISAMQRDGTEDSVFPSEPAVVVSDFLTPGETIRFKKENLLGFIVCKGGKNSHAAILARSLGVPAVVVPENMLSLLKDGTEVILNMKADELIVNPDEDVCTKAREVQEKQTEKKVRLAKLKGRSAVTTDGIRVKLYANGGSIKDLPVIADADPEGIGLFRTEFLFMEQDSLPTEEIQAAYYRQVLMTVKNKPVIFRLLDIGGDKPLPYMPHPHEKNPFLGWRGIRFLIDNPDILHTQIRGILMASASANETVRIMVPMVASVEEMETVARIIEEEKKSVGGDAVPGMMVETPAAAMTVPAYKGVSHFISIGSNDLTQYTLAADRESEQLSRLYSEFHPAVLGLMKKAVSDAHASVMETGICGEFASKPEGAALLAGIGFDELSMSPAAIQSVKEIILNCSMDELQALVARVLILRNSAAVRNAAHEFLEEKGIL